MKPGEKLARTAEGQGFRVKKTRSGYFVYAKDGVRSAGFHMQPEGSNRGMQNTLAALRRIGVQA